MNDCRMEIAGRVMRGKQVGRTLGFPTANLDARGAGPAVPNGVYLAEAALPDGRVIPAVLNQGRHPTFAEGAPTVELHLLDFSGDLYGQEIKVRYLLYLRPERAFDSPDALARQIRADVERAREWFGERGRRGWPDGE